MVNVYVVESLEPVLRCTKCGYDANGHGREAAATVAHH